MKTEPPQQVEGPDDPIVVELVNRAVSSQDAAAFGALYECFVDRVYRYLYFRSANRAEAEDLTEQVFLKAWEAIGRFRWQGRSFAAWLYRLAHNVHIDHVRSSRTHTSLNTPYPSFEVSSRTASRDFARCVDADVLDAALDHLTPDQRQVILLKFIDGLNNNEIARAMNKQEGAVRALQMRALQSLRCVLEAQGERSSR